MAVRDSQKIIARHTHFSKDVQYYFVIDDEIKPSTIVSDHDFVWQMLMNLLSNARKFTTSGYIRTRVSLSAGKCIRFTVADTGTYAFKI